MLIIHFKNFHFHKLMIISHIFCLINRNCGKMFTSLTTVFPFNNNKKTGIRTHFRSLVMNHYTSTIFEEHNTKKKKEMNGLRVILYYLFIFLLFFSFWFLTKLSHQHIIVIISMIIVSHSLLHTITHTNTKRNSSQLNNTFCEKEKFN